MDRFLPSRRGGKRGRGLHIRDTFKRGKYQDVILPLTVLRRLDCVLAPTKKRVLVAHTRFKGELENLDPQLRKAAGFAFYNTSLFDFESLLADAPGLGTNLRAYIAGFSPNMREVLEKFDFENTITKLDEAGLLFQVMERFKNVDLHPEKVSNPMMGTIFEELIRKFNEALNENPGEHFTPQDVVHLMADLLLAGDRKRIRRAGVVLTVCDPCCGTGGMLTVTKDHILGTPEREGINPEADIHLFGQEVNPETFAVCKADLFMKSEQGRDAENIAFGTVLGHDRHARRRFDYLIANPPYGKDWKRDETVVREEHERGEAGRFGAGLPRISDGQLLFLQHMLAHMKPPGDGGSRVAIIMNGSPLFTGDAGSGESEIRRWVLENDWLEALVALPEQLFYNTGIATYVWVITNRKVARRRGKVQLIDATGFWAPMRKSLGDKRRQIPPEKAADILRIHRAFTEGETCRIFPTTRFGFRKITVERPLRLNFQASPERIARLEEERAFRALAVSRKKDGSAKAREEAEGRALQERIREVLRGLPGKRWQDRTEFVAALEGALKEAGVTLGGAARVAVETDGGGFLNETAEAPLRADLRRFRPYPEYKDSGVEWLGEIPEGWEAVLLGRLFHEWDCRAGRNPGELLALAQRGLIPRSQVSQRASVSDDYSRYKCCEPGMLVMSKMQAWNGAFVAVLCEGIVSPDYTVLVPVGGTFVEFFAYLFRTDPMKAVLRGRCRGMGTAFLRLNTREFAAVGVAAPPQEEQRAIAASDREPAKIDDLTAKIRRAISLLREYHTALISAAVTGKIDVRGEAA